MLKSKYTAVLAAGVLSAASTAMANIQYSTVILGNQLNGNTYANSSTRGINSSGIVVGGMTGGPKLAGSAVSSSNDGFYYSNGTLTDVGTLPHNITTPPNSTQFATNGTSINDSNIIVGTSKTDIEPAATNQVHGFIYDPSTATMTDIQGNSAVWKSTTPVSINNSGQVTGTGSLLAAVNGTTNSVFLYSGGTLASIGFPAGVTFGSIAGITDSGIIPLGANSNVFLYNANSPTPGYSAGLNGVFGWSSSSAGAVSHNGYIVGTATVPITPATAHSPAVPVAGSYGFVYNSNTGNVTYIDTDTPTTFSSGTNSMTASDAFGVNDNGDVVGDMQQAGGGFVVMVYKNGVASPLNNLIDPSLGITLNFPGATGQMTINDAGVIATAGTSTNYLGTQALILAPVPEPAGLSILAIGAVMLGRRRRTVA